MRQYDIHRYAALGISQSDFVEEFLSFFRFTVYATNRNANVLGRRKITPDLLLSNRKVKIIDRLNTFGNLFQRAAASAAARLSISVIIGLYSSSRINVTQVLMPEALAGLSLLHQNPYIDHLLTISKEVFKNSWSEHGSGGSQLLQSIRFFEACNYLTIWDDDYVKDVYTSNERENTNNVKEIKVASTQSESTQSGLGISVRKKGKKSKEAEAAAIKTETEDVRESLRRTPSSGKNEDPLVIDDDIADLLRRLNFTEDQIISNAKRLQDWKKRDDDSNREGAKSKDESTSQIPPGEKCATY